MSRELAKILRNLFVVVFTVFPVPGAFGFTEWRPQEMQSGFMPLA
jgi:hypothetical protein